MGLGLTLQFWDILYIPTGHTPTMVHDNSLLKYLLFLYYCCNLTLKMIDQISKCSWRRTHNTGCLNFNVSKIVIIFSEGRHLWALISQLLKGQIEKFWCLSYREFPEFFKNGPTFYSSSAQWPSVTIFHKWHFFLGHPVYYSPSLTHYFAKINYLWYVTGIQLSAAISNWIIMLDWAIFIPFKYNLF